MRSTSAALLAAFLLVLSACGTQTSEIDAGAGPSGFGIGGGAGDEANASGEDSESESETDPDEEGPETEDTGVTGEASEDGAQDSDALGEHSVAEANAQNLDAALLSKILDPPEQLSSAQFEATIVTSDPDIPGQFSLRISGAYDLEDESSRISVDLSDLLRLVSENQDAAGDFAFMAALLGDGIEMVNIGDKAWVKSSMLTMFIGGDGDKWMEGSATDGDTATGDFGIEGGLLPTDLLGIWGDAEGRVEDLGVEVVRGSEATHYRVMVDAEAHAASLSDVDRDALEEELGFLPAGLVKLDLWIDDKGLLHRYTMDLSDPALLADAGSAAVGGTFSFEIWDHGADVGITPPPAQDIITEEDMSFGFGGSADFGDWDDDAAWGDLDS